MSNNASLVYVKYDPENISDAVKNAVSARANTDRGDGAAYATYVPVDGPGHVLTVVRHEGHDEHQEAEAATKEHHEAVRGHGAPHVVLGVRTAGVNIRSTEGAHGNAKPFLIVLNVEYRQEQAEELKDIGREILERSGIHAHVVRHYDHAGFVSIALPVDRLDEHDDPSDRAEEMISRLDGRVRIVSAMKFKRSEKYSSH